MNQAPFSPRARTVAQAAVEVLGERGTAGLTHRAVDQHAGLPEGSTSNHFRTRAALIGAVCRFLTDHDLEALDKASRRFEAVGEMTDAAAAEALVSIIRTWTAKEPVFTAARLELFLVARRDREVASQMSEVRSAFRQRTVAWLEDLAEGAGAHGDLVMAVVEGLTANQLLHPMNRVSWNRMTEELRLVLNAVMR